MPLRKEEYYYDEDYYMTPSYTKTHTNEELIPDVKHNNKVIPKKKNKMGNVLLGVVLFSLSLTVVYRYAMINNLNMEVIKLKSELNDINVLNTQLKFSAEKGVNLSEIEKYASEELGMQKLQSYQIEYINLEKRDLLTSKQTSENKNILSKMVTNIIDFFN